MTAYHNRLLCMIVVKSRIIDGTVSLSSLRVMACPQIIS
jgi:hypothetical protein